MHNFEYKTTKENIVKNGQSEYKILVASGALDDSYIAFAVNELTNRVQESTGCVLETVEDSVASLGGKYLVIGETRLAKIEDLDGDRATLKKGGYRIVTKDGNVFMCGANTESSMYAVISFLKMVLDFELYFTNHYSLKKNVSVLPLFDFNVTDIPDFEYRMQSCGWIRYEDKNRKRMRWTNESDWIIPVDGEKAVWHNTFNYLPPETYKASNPKWYSTPDASQLCYTAHGDQEERAKMVAIVSEKIISLFQEEKYRGYDHISVSIQDNQNCCTCETCSKAKQKYGADSAVMIMFLNDVAKQVEAWMQTEAGEPYKRDFRILFFAYHATNKPPMKYNAETGEIEPSAPEVVCHPNVVVYFAETNGDYTENFHDKGTANTEIGENMIGWGKLSKEIYFWSYSTNFWHFLTPYHSFPVVQDTLKFAKAQNCKFVMIQDQWIQRGGVTGFGVYKNWLHSKLLWDVNANVEDLKKQFFDGYFMDASKTMQQIFDEYIEWSKYQKYLSYEGARSVYYYALRVDMWPEDKLDRWIELTEQAKRAVEHYKNEDAELYEKLINHIGMESIAFRYLMIRLFADRQTPERLLELKQDVKRDILRAGITLVNSTKQTPVEELFTSWRV